MIFSSYTQRTRPSRHPVPGIPAIPRVIESKFRSKVEEWVDGDADCSRHVDSLLQAALDSVRPLNVRGILRGTR